MDRRLRRSSYAIVAAAICGLTLLYLGESGERSVPRSSATAPSRAPSPMTASRSVAATSAAKAFDPAHASEDNLMLAARNQRSPEKALDLIAVADDRFGRVHEARRLLEIERLVDLQRIGEAHARAAEFYRTFPQSPSRHRIERLTGYHPRPIGPPR